MRCDTVNDVRKLGSGPSQRRTLHNMANLNEEKGSLWQILLQKSGIGRARRAETGVSKPRGCRALREERRRRHTALTHATLTQRTRRASGAPEPPAWRGAAGSVRSRRA